MPLLTIRNIALPRFPIVKVPIALRYPIVGMDTLIQIVIN